MASGRVESWHDCAECGWALFKVVDGAGHYDGDEETCRECGTTYQISVDEDGDSWIDPVIDPSVKELEAKIARLKAARAIDRNEWRLRAAEAELAFLRERLT
jgi:hypothetical protein